MHGRPEDSGPPAYRRARTRSAWSRSSSPVWPSQTTPALGARTVRAPCVETEKLMGSRSQGAVASVNGFFRGVVIAVAGSFAVAGLITGGCLALKAEAVNGAGSPRTDVNVNAPVRCGDLWSDDHTVADEDRCRDNGWTVAWTYVLSPNGQRIWTGYPPCVEEDSGHCYWNAHTAGNHVGHSFVNLGTTNRPRLIYVHRINGHAA